jgi:hypothetical protein
MDFHFLKSGSCRYTTTIHPALSVHGMAILPIIVTAILATAALAKEFDVSSQSLGGKVACTTLKLRYPSNTFWPNTTGYTYETRTRRHWTIPHLDNY